MKYVDKWWKLSYYLYILTSWIDPVIVATTRMVVTLIKKSIIFICRKYMLHICLLYLGMIRTYTTIILSVKLVKSKKYVKYPTKTKITTYIQFNKGSIIVCDIQNNVLIKNG